MEEHMKLNMLDRIEEKYDAGDVSIAPGGWCCNCWCCCCCGWGGASSDEIA